MAISTYSELQTAVANWLDRTDLTSRIPEFIALAEAAMNRQLRVRRMVSRATATISDAFSAVPSDYLEAKSLVLSDGSTTWAPDPAAPETIDDYATLGQTGQPLFFAIIGDEIRYYPAPDRSYTATLTYYAKPTALSDANTSNWILASHPDAYLYGALLAAGPFLRDDATSTYAQLYQAAMDAITGSEKTLVGPLRTDVARALPRTSWNIRTDI